MVCNLFVDKTGLIGNERNMTDGKLLFQVIKLLESPDFLFLRLEEKFLERLNLLAGLLVKLLELENVIGDRRDAHHRLCIDCVYALCWFNLGLIFERR